MTHSVSLSLFRPTFSRFTVLFIYVLDKCPPTLDPMSKTRIIFLVFAIQIITTRFTRFVIERVFIFLSIFEILYHCHKTLVRGGKIIVKSTIKRDVYNGFFFLYFSFREKYMNLLPKDQQSFAYNKYNFSKKTTG